MFDKYINDIRKWIVDCLLLYLGMQYILFLFMFLYFRSSFLDPRDTKGRSQPSVGCYKVNIWIMLITPMISIPFSNCPVSPTD